MSYYYEFKKLDIDLPFRNSGKLKVKCPKCYIRKGGSLREKNLSINYDEGLYKCHSPNCSFQGKAGIEKDYSRPVFNNRTNLPDFVVKFFEARGISQKTIKEFKITVNEKNQLEFNYFKNGEIINKKTRFKTPEGKKAFRQHAGAEKVFYNFDSLKGKEKAIVVEGEMDVLSWAECGISKEYAIISLDQGAGAPQSKLDGKLQCLKNAVHDIDHIKKWYFALDKDASGQYTQTELIRRIGEHKSLIIDFPDGCKDTNEVLMQKEYDKSVNIQSLKLCLKDAKEVPVSGIKTLNDDLRTKMIDQFHNGKEAGKTTYYPELDKCFKFLRGDMSVFTGIPNHGKGTFIQNLAVIKAAIDGWKFGFYAPEDYDVDILFDKLIHIYIGKSPYKGHRNQMSVEEYEKGLDFVKDHFFALDPMVDEKTGHFVLPTNEWLNKKLTYAKLKYGINVYVKDPWNKISHDMGKREDQYLARELSKEKFFAKKWDAAIYIQHPSTPNKFKKQKGLDAPTAYDLSGGAMWYNQSDNIGAVHRPNLADNPKDKMVEIHIHKVKKQTLVGRPDTVDMLFDYMTQRYYQAKDDYCPLEHIDELKNGGFEEKDNGIVNVEREPEWDFESPDDFEEECPF